MDDTIEILRGHRARYPEMQTQDCVKLLYQSEFGGGHLLTDPDAALARLRAELETRPRPADVPPVEPIGGGLARLHLWAVEAHRLQPETVLGLFRLACAPRGSMDGLLEKLARLEEAFPEMRGDVAAYRAAGCPAVHHSAAFRKAYAPAYRLAPAEAQRFLPLFCAIDRLMAEKPFVRVAIDGNCASGKSTLGALLESVYGANLFHMDDYFLPFARKTPERLAEPGGNVDYERFLAEIAGQPRDAVIRWRPFDCAGQCLRPEIETPPKPLTVVEGSYSLHPTLRGAYDLKVFLSIDPERQSQRILRRNGPEKHRRFVSQWIPLENAYFDQLDIRGLCDLQFDC